MKSSLVSAKLPLAELRTEENNKYGKEFGYTDNWRCTQQQKKLNEWDHAVMFLYHKNDQKTPMSKSERQPFVQEPPCVPQMCPLGPNFWSQNFSYTNIS